MKINACAQLGTNELKQIINCDYFLNNLYVNAIFRKKYVSKQKRKKNNLGEKC